MISARKSRLLARSLPTSCAVDRARPGSTAPRAPPPGLRCAPARRAPADCVLPPRCSAWRCHACGSRGRADEPARSGRDGRVRDGPREWVRNRGPTCLFYRRRRRLRAPPGCSRRSRGGAVHRGVEPRQEDPVALAEPCFDVVLENRKERGSSTARRRHSSTDSMPLGLGWLEFLQRAIPCPSPAVALLRR